MKVIRVRPENDNGEAHVQWFVNATLDDFYNDICLAGRSYIKVKKNGCLYKESAFRLMSLLNSHFGHIRWNIWDYSGELTADENLLYDLLLKDYKNFLRLFPIITAKYRHLEFIDKPGYVFDRRNFQRWECDDWYKKRFG